MVTGIVSYFSISYLDISEVPSLEIPLANNTVLSGLIGSILVKMKEIGRPFEKIK